MCSLGITGRGLGVRRKLVKLGIDDADAVSAGCRRGEGFIDMMLRGATICQ